MPIENAFHIDYNYIGDIIKMNINIASININGLNTEIKQKWLHEFIIQHKLDIVYLQEHNIRENGKVEFLEKKIM